MQSLNQNNLLQLKCPPDGKSYAHAIQAWAVQCHSHSEQALQRAESLFEEMQGLWGNGNDDRFRPTVIAYLAMVQTITKCQHLDDHDKRRRFRKLVLQIKSHRLPKDERIMQVINQWTDNARR